MSKDIKTLGIDLAKDIFQLHGANAQGKQVLKKRLNRQNLTEFMATLPSCLVGVEACGGAHYWARKFVEMGHKVKIVAPQFVKPFVKSNKNDANDAEAISETIIRPGMRFVPIKTISQQDDLLAHRARRLAVKQRSSQAHQIRGLLIEYGIVIPIGINRIRSLPEILDENKNKISTIARNIFNQLHEQFKRYDEQVLFYSKVIETQVQQNELCREIMNIEGIGPLTASAIVASIGDASGFKNGREVAAWIGLVPKQFSSGNRIKLGGITKRGDKYLRSLLIHGARAVLRFVDNKTDKKSMWLKALKERIGFNKTAVALANKHARVVWAIMSTGECYRMPHENQDG